jgi:hypothetical protein
MGQGGRFIRRDRPRAKKHIHDERVVDRLERLIEDYGSALANYYALDDGF